ncbi:MAG: hypothetical protein ACWA5W_03035 [Phycisphaerales bacterium]
MSTTKQTTKPTSASAIYPPPHQPTVETTTSHLPSAVTFFMERGQRTKLLSALKLIANDRSAAILIALGLKPDERDNVSR